MPTRQPILVFEEPPPDRRGKARRTFPHAEIAKALRAKPGRWARLTLPDTSGNMARRVNLGLVEEYQPAGTFEAMVRAFAVYMRYVGDVNR